MRFERTVFEVGGVCCNCIPVDYCFKSAVSDRFSALYYLFFRRGQSPKTSCGRQIWTPNSYVAERAQAEQDLAGFAPAQLNKFEEDKRKNQLLYQTKMSDKSWFYSQKSCKGFHICTKYANAGTPSIGMHISQSGESDDIAEFFAYSSICAASVQNSR